MMSRTLEAASAERSVHLSHTQSKSAWMRQGTLTVVDQALISGSNFVLGVLLARWLSSSAYGAYAVAFAIFLLLVQLHQAALLEPMSVFGGGVYRQRLKPYLGDLLWIHGATSIVIFLVLGTLAFLIGRLSENRDLPRTLAVVSVAAPLILLFWLARRACYLEHAPSAATLGSMVYSGIVLGGVFVFFRLGILSAPLAFVLMGAAALCTSVFMWMRLRPHFRWDSHPFSSDGVWGRHYRYGRWALASSVCIWITSSYYYVLLGRYGTLHEAGELRALLNFVLPVVQTVTALTMLVQPRLAHVALDRGASAVVRWSFRMSLFYAAGAGLYWLLIYLFRHDVVRLLYGGNYANVVHFVPIVALASILQSAVSGVANGLRAMESPSAVFVHFGVASIITIAIGTPVALNLGVGGAVSVWALANSAGLVVGAILLWRMTRRPS
jgi:O-antigen/teichoic acid export membrane protein